MDITYVFGVLASRRWALYLAVMWTAVALAACGSSTSTNVTGPTASKCQVAVSNSASELPAAGGSARLTVTSERECAWSAHTDAPWISLSSTSGQGAAVIDYTVTPNPNGAGRRAQVVVSNQSVDVAQQPAPCQFAVAPGRVDVGPSQSTVSFALTATPGCAWVARSTVDWIVPVPPASGTGNANVTFTLSANPAAARAGIVAIGDAQAAVNQQAAGSPAPPSQPPPSEPPGPGCSFTVAPLSATVPAEGGDVPIAVTGPDACAWAASSNADWISITSGFRPGMAGSATIVVAASANSGPARTGTISVAGQLVTITQPAAAAPAPGCTYQLTPASADITSNQQDLSVAMATTSDCAWALTSDAPWITVADPGPGTGAGAFRVTIAANTGDARTGVVHAATATLTVNQAAAPPALCTYAIDPTSYDAAPGGDAVDVHVTAGLICAWTASTDAPWITIASGAIGLANGTVHLEIAANGGPPRVGTVTVAGQPFTVRQPAACTYSLKPTSAMIGNRATTIKVDVNTGPGCAWTASSPAPWVTIDPAAGTGKGQVNLTIGANDGPDRAVTLTIAGQPFELTQKGK
jgi:hypothetical protein